MAEITGTTTSKKMIDHQEHMDKFREILEHNYELIKKKNMKYGNRWRDFGVVGMLLEILKKAGRLKNMTFMDETKSFHGIGHILGSVEEEGSIYDTVQDLANYCMFLQILFVESDPSILRGGIQSNDRSGPQGGMSGQCGPRDNSHGDSV